MLTDINSLSLDKTYTYADYITWEFKERIELIKGMIFKMSPAPNLEHQKISATLLGETYAYLKGKSCKVFAAPFDVRLSDTDQSNAEESISTVVQPDICVICDLSKLDKQGCNGAPDLVVEILSPSTAQKDMNEKFAIYEAHKVKEYWIVFPYEQLIQVFKLNPNNKYALSKAYGRSELIPMGIFEDFEIDLNIVFEEMP